MLPGFDVIREQPKTGEDLVILPVYNELPVLPCALAAIQLCYHGDILVVDDASTDGSGALLDRLEGFSLIRNQENAGAGGVLLRGFDYALRSGHRFIVTMDADGQHNACQIEEFLRVLKEEGVDMVWGTRYPGGYTPLAEPFQARQKINRLITQRLQAVTRWPITDSFCGFRAYRRRALECVQPEETGYGMLLEFAVLAHHAGLSVVEHPVPLIYLDDRRDFNQQFTNAEVRLAYYLEVIENALCRVQGGPPSVGESPCG